jgi:membrane-associated phospholipid phosphatase
MGKVARDFFQYFPYVPLVVFVTPGLLKLVGIVVPFAPNERGAWFLLVTLLLGPGLIVNLGLKDHSHRPRPVHVLEFGGEAPFMPWESFDGACAKNCSFASGEAAQGFWMVAPALLTPPPWRPLAIVAALAFGFGASLLRVATGGHFLSDVTAGGLIALIVVFGLKRAFWPRGGP